MADKSISKPVQKFKRCPICQTVFPFYEDYEPSTCHRFDCLYRFLHPELKGAQNGN